MPHRNSIPHSGWLLALTTSLLISACGPASPAATSPPALAVAGDAPSEMQPIAAQPLTQMALVGRQLFFEPALSASGRQSCASCHSPQHAYGPPNGEAVQHGGADLGSQGARAAPNLTYLLGTPNFSIGMDNDATGEPHVPVEAVHAMHQSAYLAAAPPPNPARLARVLSGQAKAAGAVITGALVPQGGLFWDGRSDTLQGQALLPLLDPQEMDNVTPEQLISRLQKLPAVESLKLLAGPAVVTDPKLLLAESLFAIGRYEAEEKSFAPYSSKYDHYLHGEASLSESETRGLKLFEDPKKGNCAACHPSRPNAAGEPPVFTDYQYEALGVPRNPEITVNRDPAYYDLGICGPKRVDIYAQQPSNCGLFRTPSLRNVATRGSYFHNGRYHRLEDVLAFYVDRDLHPERFYPKRADGRIEVFDDLPPRYRGNVDRTDAPLDRKPGDPPALDVAEQRDIIAFLGTLSDAPASPGP